MFSTTSKDENVVLMVMVTGVLSTRRSSLIYITCVINKLDSLTTFVDFSSKNNIKVWYLYVKRVISPHPLDTPELHFSVPQDHFKIS